ncbi:MAG: sensor histidine kinase [Bacteroidetes bacterium CHB5]|nr:sensor histidine kinase [Bacteroidetes bacterium CHB5]
MRRTLGIVWLSLVPVVGGNMLHAQTQSIDEKIIQMPDDTAKVNRMNERVLEIRYEDPQQAIELLQEAIRLAERLDYPYGLSVACLERANLFFYEMKLDTAWRLLNKSFALVSELPDARSQKQAATIVQRFAAIYQQRQQYDSAVILYQDAVSRFTGLNDRVGLIFCFYNLSGIYNTLGDSGNALLYAHETNRISNQTGDSIFLIRSYMALADAFAGAKNFDSVYHIAQQGLVIANMGSQSFPVGKFHLLIGSYFENRALYDSAIRHYTVAFQAFAPINLGYEVSLALYHIGHCYIQKHNYTLAVHFLKQAEEKSRAFNLIQVLVPCLADLAIAGEKTGDLAESLQYLKEYAALRDTLTLRNNRKLVYDLEAKYQLQKKEQQIQLQEELIQKKNLLNYLLVGTVVSVMAVLFFLYYTFLQRRKLQEQRIRDLEQEKKLLAGEAVIKGQEEERGRLAKDLHDGLGGILSGIKFSLINMKSNVVLDSDNALLFERSLDMLDHSIAELRRVAHNMMPEVLVKFGLTEALKSYCESVRQSGIFKIDFQSIGMNERLDSNTEIIVYRIVQELLNNIAKHAKASLVMVQVARHEREVSITVEDDGEGFDPRTLEKSDGSGWVNIHSRVEYLKGKVDIQSAKGEGTSVHIIIVI